MKIYISGPITGCQDMNRKAFAEVGSKSGGLVEYVNPHTIHPYGHTSWEGYMRRDLKALVDCQAIHMLPGWRWSKGARLEHLVAKKLGIKEVRQPGGFWDSWSRKPWNKI